MAHMNRPHDMPEPPSGEHALGLAKQLVKAVHDRDLQALKELLDAGADPLINTTGHAVGAAVDVAIVKFVPGLELMVRAPRVLNSIDEEGATLMHRAAVLGPPDAILCLAKAGLWLDSEDRNGMTPLYRSAEAGGNGTMTQAGPAIARNVACLLALGAEPLRLNELNEIKPEINGGSFGDIMRANIDRGPLSNAVRSLSEKVVQHVMTERMRAITDEDYASAKGWIEERSSNGFPLSAEIEPLFNGFFHALKARDLITSVRGSHSLKMAT